MELFAFFFKNINGILRYVFYKAYTVLLFSKPGQFYSLSILTAFQIYYFYSINLKTNKIYIKLLGQGVSYLENVTLKLL